MKLKTSLDAGAAGAPHEPNLISLPQNERVVKNRALFLTPDFQGIEGLEK